MQFKVNSKEFLKFIKLFKLDPSLYLTITPSKIIVKNIDFKNFLGVVEAEFLCQTEVTKNMYLKIEYLDLCTKLDNFKDLVVFQMYPMQNLVKLYDPVEPSYDYIIRGEYGLKTEKYATLSIVDNRIPGDVEFSLKSEDCLDYFKIITAVENTMFFRCFKDYSRDPIQLISKKITSIGNKTMNSEHVYNYHYNTNDPVYEFEVYYPNLASLFIKEVKEVNFKVLDNYLIMESPAEVEHIYFKIHLPLREVH